MGQYRKLVRDRIPEIIKLHGERPIVRKLRMKEYKEELLKKLVEEAREVQKAEGKDALTKELGDIQEVIMALYNAFGVTREQVTNTARKRRLERGAFKKRLYLEGVK